MICEVQTVLLYEGRRESEKSLRKNENFSWEAEGPSKF